MHITDETTARPTIIAVCTVTDLAERQRRLAQAYGLILDFGRQKKARTQVTAADSTQRTD